MPTPVSVGVLAHVDAGKTTLLEQMLYHVGALRAPGRVDHGDTALDVDEIERSRGITVFSDQWWFDWGGARYTLVDTPGHVDFAAEAERAMLALDVAILLIDGSAGVQAHTVTLFQLAARYGVPVVLFVNKTDLPAYHEARILAQIEARLTSNAVRIAQDGPDAERLALLDDAFCEAYLSGAADNPAAWDALSRLFRQRAAFPLLHGAALRGQGIAELLDALSRLSRFAAPDANAFDALVYKVRHDPGGERVTFLKILSGTLRARDAFRFPNAAEKVHQLRLYRGAAYTLTDSAAPGELVGVTGLATPHCGDRLRGDALDGIPMRMETEPVLSARAEPPEGVAPAVLLEKLRLLEDEEPTLSVSWDALHGHVLLRVMGTVQMEVLAQLIQNRFGLAVRFLPPLVLYRETIAEPVVGCGHYEPLRHYAEAHLRLSPAPRGEGITFQSRCHVDNLALSWQNLIRTHVFERTHRGVLTGSPLTDVRVELLSGRAHLKHTEGGDFRQATCRAIRQGLEKAQSVLLEPFYRFALTVPADCLGRAMSDITALFGVYDAPETIGDEARLTGRGPVRTLMDYPTAVRAYTHGRGTLQLQPDGYDPCHNPEEVIAEIAYDRGADLDNPSSSIFCSHGAGYAVPWNDADALMHLPVEDA